MHVVTRLFTVFVIWLLPFCAKAQVQWIADMPFEHSSYASLYKMVEDGKPAVIALGNMHSQSSSDLLTSNLLQKLSREHDVGTHGDHFSTKDLRIAFINVRIMNIEGDQPNSGIDFIHINESDEALNGNGWNEMYSIAATGLFLVTPDHLVRPLKGKTANEVYEEVKAWSTRIRPSDATDIRLLDAMISNPKTVQVRVQNFSIVPVNGIEITILKDGQPIAVTTYHTPIASLEDAVIPVTIQQGVDSHLTIIAKASGDVNDFNNRWTATLRTTIDPSIVAGTFLK